MTVAFLGFPCWLNAHEKSDDKKRLSFEFATILFGSVSSSVSGHDIPVTDGPNVHDLNADAVHSTTKVLHNVKAIKDNLSVRE